MPPLYKRQWRAETRVEQLAPRSRIPATDRFGLALWQPGSGFLALKLHVIAK